MRRRTPGVYLVSASPVMRHSLASLFAVLGHDVRSFATIHAILANFPCRFGCLCIDAQDLDLPPANCLRLLSKRQPILPLVLLVGPLTAAYRAALCRLYAPLQVLTKPVSGRRLIEVVDSLSGGAPPTTLTR